MDFGHKYAPMFRRLWTKFYQIKKACACGNKSSFPKSCIVFYQFQHIGDFSLTRCTI